MGQKGQKNDKGKPEEEGAGGMRARKQWRIRCDNSGLMGKQLCKEDEQMNVDKAVIYDVLVLSARSLIKNRKVVN